MASINLNGKRRRVEQAASGLAKPFKSPLRRPSQTPQKEKAIVQENDDASIKSTSQTSHSLSDIPQDTPASSAGGPKRKHLTPPKKPMLADPAIQDLQKQQRALQARLTALRSELDTAQQALRIESTDKAADLEALIAKWRSVSQTAAEEVFTGAQERVSRMGGMKAWKERMRSDTARWEKEEMEAWYGDAEAEEFEMDREELEARKAEMGDRVAVDEAKKEEQNELDDEEFTMEVMLKTLNVDVKVIGYDVTEQKWMKP
ncbi:hypothetical protein BDV59DRAFT_143293 [Aspergillus ambiguus]|uniref:putative DNA repair protein Dds20/Mei5 n=1 Tax=Aspergillus ambiguus TaxID=176160 RepID=UPI003CCD9068